MGAIQIELLRAVILSGDLQISQVLIGTQRNVAVANDVKRKICDDAIGICGWGTGVGIDVGEAAGCGEGGALTMNLWPGNRKGSGIAVTEVDAGGDGKAAG